MLEKSYCCRPMLSKNCPKQMKTPEESKSRRNLSRFIFKFESKLDQSAEYTNCLYRFSMIIDLLLHTHTIIC